MLPTVTIMKNLIECVLFQGFDDFDHLFLVTLIVILLPREK